MEDTLKYPMKRITKVLPESVNKLKMIPKKERAEQLKTRAYHEFSIPYGHEEGLEIRKLNMEMQEKSQKHKFQKLSLGIPTYYPTKVILLVGATGSGKTTLINSMVNYIYKVQFKDNFRFILIDDTDVKKKRQSESQTDLITVYSFYYIDGMPFNYNYILIDTPGFGDTRGIQRDKEMMKQLEMFFNHTSGIDTVDSIGFVTQSSAAWLTHTQRYVYDGLSSMFGKDVKDNIYIMATFADANRPKVLHALKDANVDYAGFYKFNNCAVYASNKGAQSKYEDSDSYSESHDEDDDDNDDEDDDESYMNKIYWKMGYKSMNKFFNKFMKTKPASLTLTKEVLKERRHLETTILGLSNQINLDLEKLSNLNQERDMLNRFKDDVKGCENYEEEIEVPQITSVHIPKGKNVTNCLKCGITCHYPCVYADDKDKIKCSAMGQNRYCRVCPKNCYWDIHKNMGFKYVHSWVKEMRTVQDLLNRYTNAKQGMLSKEKAVKSIECDINNSTLTLKNMIQEAHKNIKRLEEIALKPNPLSTKEYIELMIESEKMQKLHNYDKRIEVLETLKKEASILKMVKEKPQASGKELLKYFQNI